MSTLLVDADVVAYQVAFSTEEAIRWGQEDDEYAIWKEYATSRLWAAVYEFIPNATWAKRT